MKPSNIRIVTDSSSDLLELPGIGFASAPLKIITAQREYIDNRELDVAAMVQELAAYHGRSSTSCPGPGDWLDAFGDAEEIFCVTITSSLSGSCSAACVAREQYLRKHPNRRVQIIDSLSVGPEMQLLIEKIRDCILAGCDFAQTCAAAAAYRQKTRLLFLLESMKNLANNGRIKHITAKAAGLLGIRAIGRASDHGTLEMLDKARGEKRALRHGRADVPAGAPGRRGAHRPLRQPGRRQGTEGADSAPCSPGPDHPVPLPGSVQLLRRAGRSAGGI